MLVDCFTFYNELEMLKKRLAYLSPIVDKFVLVESNVTFRGNPKKLFYDEHRDMFSEWKDKIIHVVVDDNPDGKDPWLREYHQRNCILRGLESFDDDTLVMISDVDEVPDRNYIKLPPDVDACSFNMTAFQYSLKYIQKLEPWFGTVLTKKRAFEHVNPQYLRDHRQKFPHYREAGWHFSSFGDDANLFEKVQNFSHCYDDDVVKMDPDTCKKFIEEGLHAGGRYKLELASEELLSSVPNEFKGDTQTIDNVHT